MNRNILFNYMANNLLETGNLVGYYSFGSYSGEYTFNEKYTNPKSTSVVGGIVDSTTYPLYSLCDTNNVNSISGSGYFDHDTVIKMGNKFSNENWTIILSYYTENFSSNQNVGRTLFSTMDSPTATSGFHIGLNGAQKLYFEYKDKDAARQIFTLNAELGKRNIVSISRSQNSKNVELIFHDELYKNGKTGSFNTSNSVTTGDIDKIYSDNLYLGDFFTVNSEYTGFSGYFDDLLVFKEALSFNVKDDLAKLLVSSGYTTGGASQQSFTFSGISSGSPTLTTGVTGQGVTGYENVVSGNISARCGSDIPLYVSSGVTGDLTGVTISFTTGTSVFTGTKFVTTDPEILVSNAKLKTYSRNNLSILYNAYEDIDTFQSYSYSDIYDDLNKTASAVESSTDYFDLGTGYSQGTDINLYLNGIYQRSGVLSGESIVSGDFYISGTGHVVPEFGVKISGNYHNNIYDKISGTTYFASYDSGSTDWTLTNPNYLNKDIYINGKRLTSGVNYTEASTSITIKRNTLNSLPSGEMAFLPRKNPTYVKTNPAGGGTWMGTLIYQSSGWLSEQLWFNGQRLTRNKDYLLVSDNSLLNNTNKIRFIDDFSVYKGEEEGF